MTSRSSTSASFPALLAALLTLILAGCGPSDAPSPPGATEAAKASSKPRVALIMKSLANEFFLTMENGARAHQKAHAADYELLANGIKDELDVARQIDMVEQMIAQKVDAIVIAPADSKALVAACAKAQAAGMVVVNIDNKFDQAVLDEKKVRIPFVGPDNRRGARKVGDHLAKQLKPGDAVAIIDGAPNAFNAVQRQLGFADAMAAAGMKVVTAQSGYWETDKANQVAAAMITEHPQLKALLCANDSMALGAVAALRAAGKQGQVLVVGYDNIGAVQSLLKEGRILATADQHADQIAVFGIEYALDLLKSGVAPADKETPVELVTAPAPTR
ncbi:MAG: sugar ABC transporter substrate-binding protein [Verrucomicrobiales bacterium]|nr:sugar ABC transporter substrate-binding protein [Verrucomicrobiales bacterium]